MAKRSTLKRPRDPNQLAKFIVDLSTGQLPEPVEPANEKNAAAVALGRLGGLKGGKTRAANLSPETRKVMAQNAANARWASRKKGQK